MKHSITLCMLVLLMFASASNAQILRISTLGQEGIVMGDLTKKGINSPASGYVDYVSVGGLEVNFYPNNKFGIGIRWFGNYYGRDYESYEADLKDFLNITDDQYDITQSYGYWAMGSDLGISYLFSLSEKLQFEPYFYLGFKVMTTPATSVIYYQNSTTYTYKSKPHPFFGVGYAPGVKLSWNIFKHAGLFLSAEYNGSAFVKDEERSMTYSYNTLDINDIEKSYKISSVNLGLGLAVRFGKGLAE